MFKRDHHNKILKVLHAMNSDILAKSGAYFGGETAIALQLDEYRESVDIDFLCDSTEGYSLLRSLVVNERLDGLFCQPIQYLRETRKDRDKIYTALEVDGTPIKFEIVLEARIKFDTMPIDQTLQVPVLSKTDLFTEKLLATSDRGLDRDFFSRDLIDIAMMMHAWGEIPMQAWQKAGKAYSPSVIKRDYDAARKLLSNDAYRKICLSNMNIDDHLDQTIIDKLNLSEFREL